MDNQIIYIEVVVSIAVARIGWLKPKIITSPSNISTGVT